MVIPFDSQLQISGGRASGTQYLVIDGVSSNEHAPMSGNLTEIRLLQPNAVVRPKGLIGSKAYDVDSLRRWLKERRIKANISASAGSTVPYLVNRTACRRCDRTERLFSLMNNRRHIATRYDRSACYDLTGQRHPLRKEDRAKEDFT